MSPRPAVERSQRSEQTEPAEPAPRRVLLASCAAWLSTANMPRLLHRAGARITFLGPGDAWPLRGSFIAEHVPANGAPHEVARALQAHLERAAYDWVIVGDDNLLRALAALRAEPWVRGVLPLEPDPIRAGLLGSKVGFVQAVRALGLPLPESRVCLGRDDVTAVLRELGPLMIKEDGLSGGQGCHRVERAEDVAALPAHVFAAPVVAQAFVRGPVYSVEALYQRGELRAALTSRVVRTWPVPFGPSAVRNFIHHPGAFALAAEIGRVTGVHGFGNITLVEDANGRLLLIELDPRPNALFHLGDLLGVAMVETLRELIDDRADVAAPRHVAPALDIEVPVYPLDVIRCLVQRDLPGLAAWALDLDGRWRFVPRGDARLGAAYRRHIARQVARHLLPEPLRKAVVRLRSQLDPR